MKAILAGSAAARRLLRCTVASIVLSFLSTPATAEILPHVARNGAAIQLIVDGEPWIALAGEVHNSTPSNIAYMAPVWDRLESQNLNTVITPVYWELVEPEEGQYDFALVDEQIRQARSRNMRLVLMWFGTLKNAKSTYAPIWVRADRTRFPRAALRPGEGRYENAERPLSVFSDAVVEADAKAFSQLMEHLARTDPQHTVIAVQVENEAGLLGDSRDRSPVADQAWRAPVPEALMAHLARNEGRLEPSLEALWARNGNRRSGNWSEVFGDDWEAEELFMAWGVGSLVERLASAGQARLDLPMYANAWLGPQAPGDRAGVYPSGGPVPRVFDVWHAAAPSLSWLSPDIYVDDFQTWATAFARPENPLFIPEARFSVGNLFVALGDLRAIGFSPFGIEDGLPTNQIAQAYALLDGMRATIASAQANESIAGFALNAEEAREVVMGDYVVTIRGGRDALRQTLLDMGVAIPIVAPPPQPQNIGNAIPEMTDQRSTGMLLQLGPDDFLIVGKDLDVSFKRRSRVDEVVELARVEEGRFGDDRWVRGRVLNGDERLQILPFDDIGMARIQLLRHR
jgi:hypothetical protein